MSQQNWIRSCLTDENGQFDVAFVSLFFTMAALFGSIVIMTTMSTVAHFRCSPHELLVKDVVTIIACVYDPQPLGVAIGAACGGFGVALASLAAYMAATRKPQGSSTVTTSTQTTTATAPMATGATADDPVHVAVADEKPKGKR